MANRWFNQFQGTLEKGVVTLFLDVAIGATGAPTLSRGKGVASIARSGAGTYLVTLQDKYVRLLSFGHARLVDGDPAGPLVNLLAEDVASAKTLSFQCNAVDGTTATDPAEGERVLLRIELSNSGAL